MVEVALAPIRGLRDDAAQLGAGRAILGEVFHRGLNLIFYLVRQLLTAGREELNAVIRHRVVGSRNHHAEIRAVVICQVGNRRGRQHTHAHYVNPAGGQTGGNRRVQHLTGNTRVAADNGQRPTLIGFPLGGEYLRSGLA